MTYSVVPSMTPKHFSLRAYISRAVNPTPLTKLIYKGRGGREEMLLKTNNQATLKNRLGDHPPPRLAWLNLILMRLNPNAAPSPGVGWKALAAHPMAAISKGFT